MIETADELDIVAVYTTANFETEQIMTQDIEHVAPREIVHELPDLVPVPDGNGSYCRRSGDSLLVTVVNQGLGTAAASMTEVDFFDLGSVVVDTPSLDPGTPTNLLFDTPPNFWTSGGRKNFQIMADVTLDVPESNEGNNMASGVCIIVE